MLITFVFVFNVIIESGIDGASTALNVGQWEREEKEEMEL